MDLILGLALAAIVFLMANGLFHLFNRPKVTPINKDQRPHSALLVVDMQVDYLKAHDPAAIQEAIGTIESLASEKQQQGIPALEIHHIFVAAHEKLFMRLFAGGAGVEGSAGVGRAEALNFKADQFFIKHQADSFAQPDFEEYLAQHKIGHLYLTGQEANACILATANGARARGYDVTLIDQAILAKNQDKWQKNKEKLLKQGAKIQ